MDKVQALKGTDIEKYEWLSSGGKNTNGLFHTNLQAIGKPWQEMVGTLSFPGNWSETIKYLAPLIIANFFGQSAHDIANSADDGLEIFVAKNISKIPEVECILVSKIHNYYEIWTVINKLDREVRERIYDEEYNILETFKDIYFDFHVICRDDRNINEFLPTNATIFYRKTV